MRRRNKYEPPAIEVPAEQTAVPFAREFAHAQPGESRAPVVVASGANTKTQVNWIEVTFVLWLAGAGVLGLGLAWTNLRFWSRIRRQGDLRDQRPWQVLAEAREALHVRQPITLIETEAVATPAIYGLWRKRLLLPGGVVQRFSDQELRHIFLHELAHLKRRDLEINWLVRHITEQPRPSRPTRASFSRTQRG